MSQFSDYLEELVTSCDDNVSKLAEKAKVSHTTILRAKSGKCLPGISFVEKLCDYMHVSPAEREVLMHKYYICDIGEEIYAGIKYVEKIIEQIATLHIYENSDSAVKKVATHSIELDHDGTVFVGQYSVNGIIRDILEDEAYNSKTPSISLSVPFAFEYLFDCLKQLYWDSHGTLAIQHILEFSKNPHKGQNPNVNLATLSNALPFAFCMGNGYQPHYYYSASTDAENFIQVMPFYFYTGKYLVTISSDFESAIVYKNQDILKVYQNHFQGCFSQSLPLVQQLGGVSDMITVGYGQVLENQQVAYVIEPQPCFSKYYTLDMIEEYMRQEVPNREEMKALMFALYNGYNQLSSPLNSFFTISGLSSMVDTGEMAEFPSKFTLPFSISTRLYLLKSLRRDIQSDAYYSRIIDTSKIQVSDIATIQILNNKSLLFWGTTDNGSFSCVINEHSIGDAFFDFFESLPDSKLLFSKEDTIKVIDEMILKLKCLKES